MFALVASYLIIVLGISSFIRTRWLHSVGYAPTVRYLLPWVGSIIQYTKDPIHFMKRCSERYGSTFQIILGGKAFTVVCDAKGLDSIFRDKKRAFNLHPAHLRIAQAIGGVKQADIVVHLISDRFFPIVTRSLSREGMDKYVPAFNEDLLSVVESMANRVRDSSNGRSFPLMAFIGKSMYHSITKAAYGPLYPFETYDDFETCDYDLILLISRVPFLSRRVIQARQRLSHALGNFVERAWLDGQLNGGSTMASEVVSILRDSDLDRSDVGGALFTLTWGMLSNPIRITYWLMVFLLNDAESAAKIREEVDRELRDNFGGDIKRLFAAPYTGVDEHFPLLESAVNETMRIGILQSALREAQVDTELATESGTVRIRKGELVMTNISAVHLDAEYYSEPEIFRPDRFLGEKGRPHMGFGGGRHLVCSFTYLSLSCVDLVAAQCKGKLFAVHVVKMLVVLCFEMFDMRIVDASGKSIVGDLPPPDPRRSVSVLRPSSQPEIFLHAKIRDKKIEVEAVRLST